MKCPAKCQDKEFSFHDCITEPGALPEDGDIGMCSFCGQWWILRDGECAMYEPRQEDLLMVVPHMSESRERADAHAKAQGKRLL